MNKLFPALILIWFAPKAALAHCPLCTAGAGALAILAASLGVSSVVIGVLIGAFALALGLWLAGLVSKQYFAYQKPVFTALIYLGTVLPVMPLVRHYGPFYVPFIGEYGTTYTINLYLLGVIIGTFLMFVAPVASKQITKLRGKRIPFQGIATTISLLILVSIIIQLLS